MFCSVLFRSVLFYSAEGEDETNELRWETETQEDDDDDDVLVVAVAVQLMQ